MFSWKEFEQVEHPEQVNRERPEAPQCLWLLDNEIVVEILAPGPIGPRAVIDVFKLQSSLRQPIRDVILRNGDCRFRKDLIQSQTTLKRIWKGQRAFSVHNGLSRFFIQEESGDKSVSTRFHDSRYFIYIVMNAGEPHVSKD